MKNIHRTLMILSQRFKKAVEFSGIPQFIDYLTQTVLPTTVSTGYKL